MATTVYSSVQPLLALLSEPDAELQTYALETLDSQIETFWSELSSSLSTIEELAENTTFSGRKLACIVVSKIYFYLGALPDALRYIIDTDVLLDQKDTSLFRSNMLTYFLDSYIEYRATLYPAHLRSDNFKPLEAKLVLSDVYNNTASNMSDDGSSSNTSANNKSNEAHVLQEIFQDSKVEALVFRLIDQAIAHKEWNSVLGLLIETCHTDKLREVLIAADTEAAPLLKYLVNFCCTSINSQCYRKDLLEMLVSLYEMPSSASKDNTSTDNGTTTSVYDDQSYLCRTKLPELSAVSDIPALVECLYLLENYSRIANILAVLSKSEDMNDQLLATQIAFDLGATQNASLQTIGTEFSKITGAVPYDYKHEQQQTLGSGTGTSASPATVTGDVSSSNNTPLVVIKPKSFERGTNQVDMAVLRASADEIEKKKKEYERKLKYANQKKNNTTSANNNSTTTTEPPQPPTYTLEHNVLVPTSSTISTCPSVPKSLHSLDTPTIISSVLNNTIPSMIYLHYLYSKARIDTTWLEYLHGHLEARNSTLQTALVTGVGLALAGTRRDEWVRANWSWIDEGLTWSKFTSRAFLGSIYRGDVTHAYDSIAPFLPDGSAYTAGGAGGAAMAAKKGKTFSEGGALYALGIATAGICGDKYVGELSSHLTSTEEPVQHGAALGTGLAALGTANLELYETLREIIMGDGAIAGEAAGYAIGSIFAGCVDEHPVIPEELIAYMHATQHEKICRGLAIGVALMCIGAAENASNVWKTMIDDTNATIRYGGVYALALAYIGTGSTAAVSELLRLAVSDGNNDVRRAAVMGVAFVACNVPHSIPKLLSSLSESFNPYVRHATAVAIGIGTAGCKNNELGLAILAKMLQDKSDIVRQGVFIGLSFLVMCSGTQSIDVDGNIKNQVSAEMTKRDSKKDKDVAVSTTTNTDAKKDDKDKIGKEKEKEKENIARTSGLKLLRSAIKQQLSRRADTTAKIGALYAAGIAEAGGCNQVFSMLSGRAQPQLCAIVGTVLFTQYWYWQPIVSCLALAFRPSAIIGVTKSLRVPTNWQVVATAPMSVAGYIDTTEFKKAKETKSKINNVLSQASRQKKKNAATLAKEKAAAEEKSNEPLVPSAVQAILQCGYKEVSLDNNSSSSSTSTDEQKQQQQQQQERKVVVVCQNPFRVPLTNIQYTATTTHYVPVKRVHSTGIIMLRNLAPEEDLYKEEEEARARENEEEIEVTSNTSTSTATPAATTEDATTTETESSSNSSSNSTETTTTNTNTDSMTDA